MRFWNSHSSEIMHIFSSLSLSLSLFLSFSFQSLHMSEWIFVIWLFSHRNTEQSCLDHAAVTMVIHMGGYSFFSRSPFRTQMDNTTQISHSHILNNKCKVYGLLVPAGNCRTSIFKIGNISSFSPRSIKCQHYNYSDCQQIKIKQLYIIRINFYFYFSFDVLLFNVNLLACL